MKANLNDRADLARLLGWRFRLRKVSFADLARGELWMLILADDPTPEVLVRAQIVQEKVTFKGLHLYIAP